MGPFICRFGANWTKSPALLMRLLAMSSPLTTEMEADTSLRRSVRFCAVTMMASMESDAVVESASLAGALPGKAIIATSATDKAGRDRWRMESLVELSSADLIR